VIVWDLDAATAQIAFLPGRTTDGGNAS
jgi:hypothetical protein